MTVLQRIRKASGVCARVDHIRLSLDKVKGVDIFLIAGNYTPVGFGFVSWEDGIEVGVNVALHSSRLSHSNSFHSKSHIEYKH